jgi:hypothetical protein
MDLFIRRYFGLSTWEPRLETIEIEMDETGVVQSVRSWLRERCRLVRERDERTFLSLFLIVTSLVSIFDSEIRDIIPVERAGLL